MIIVYILKMKINVTQHKQDHELSGDRKGGGKGGTEIAEEPRTHLGFEYKFLSL
jgi:hypothetical protein